MKYAEYIDMNIFFICMTNYWKQSNVHFRIPKFLYDLVYQCAAVAAYVIAITVVGVWYAIGILYHTFRYILR